MQKITIFFTVFFGLILLSSDSTHAFISENKTGIIVAALLIAGFFILEFVLRHFVNIPTGRQKRLDYLDRILQNYGKPAAAPLPYFMFEETFTEAAHKREADILLAVGDKVIDKHMDVLARKRKQFLYTDDYGRQQRSGWDKEIEYFIRTVFIPEIQTSLSTQLVFHCPTATMLSQDNKDSIAFWTPHIDELSAIHVNYQDDTEFDEFMSGHEYEHFVAELVRQYGWDARVTSGSGDHGADIIVEKKGLRLAVQCKLYSSPVGNKSVQEAFSAQRFYDCGRSCVVTNSSFTPAARKAASKLNVSLLHHEELGNYLSGLA